MRDRNDRCFRAAVVVSLLIGCARDDELAACPVSDAAGTPSAGEASSTADPVLVGAGDIAACTSDDEA
ncbi:MAG: hypothetical protein ACXVEF_43535, partial [Polyangiales bacterium]